MNSEIRKWTCARIAELPGEQQLAMSVRMAGSLLHQKVLLGRCLAALRRTHAYETAGCSSAIHYARLELGVEEREAREVLLAAERLENLPILTRAVEENEITWSKLRLVLSRADETNEGWWLEQAKTLNVRALEKLVRQAAKDDGESKLVCYEVWLPEESLSMLQRAFTKLRSQAGRFLSDAECLEYLAAANLAGAEAPDTKTVEQLREQARLDVAARAPVEVPQVVELPAGWENKRLRFSGLSMPITGAQRREILRRDGYNCAVPSCCNRQWLEVHHLTFRCEGGVSVRSNLVTVCSTCHAHIHRGLLEVRGQPPHQLVWTDRNGRELGVKAVPCESRKEAA